MKINLSTSGTSTEESQKIVYWLAIQMCREYHIGSQGIMYFTHEGSDELCKWIKSTYQINATKWEFIESDNKVIGSGFDLEDSPSLTALLLTIPNGPLKFK